MTMRMMIRTNGLHAITRVPEQDADGSRLTGEVTQVLKVT